MRDLTLERLLQHGFDFLTFGLRLILSPTATQIDTKVSVANIQIGLELLIKYRLAKNHGLQHICLTDLSNLSAAQIEANAEAGIIKTKKFEWCKQAFVVTNRITGYERDLIDRFQRLRNSIVHFGVELPREETITACAHIILKVVRRIVEFEADPWLSRYLPQDVYQALIKFPSYVAEAVDDAYGSGKDVRLCFECNNETLTTLPGGNHYCFSCGYQIFTGHAPYIDCPYCKSEKTAVYDSLNDDDGIYRGKCISCEETLLVAKCGLCEIEVFPEVFAQFDGEKWYCKECYEPVANLTLNTNAPTSDASVS